MRRTLRVDDSLYSQAKAKAALEGISLDQFVEEGLQMRLEGAHVVREAKPYSFYVFQSGNPFLHTAEDVKRLSDDAQNEHDITKLG